MPASPLRRRALFVAAAAAVTLAACGGGGGGSPAPVPPPPPPSTAEGFWTGTVSSGFSILGAVLENGEYWVMYYANGRMYGVVQGSGTSNNGNFTSNNGVDLFFGGSVTPVAVAASYRSRQSLQGTVTAQAGGGAVTFTAAYEPGYDTPASLAAASGVWRGVLASGESYTLNVGANGAFTGAGTSGCTFAGTVAPRASGKGVFNVTATFNGGVCLLGTQTIAGIGVIAGTGQAAQLYVAGLNAARNAGYALVMGR